MEFDIPDDATVIDMRTSWGAGSIARGIALTYWIPVKKDHWDNDRERG